MKYVLVFLLIGFNAGPGTAQSSDRAKTLHNNYKNKKALKLYHKILADDSTNIDALWLSGLLYSRIGDNLKKKARKKKYYKRAVERARKALNIDKTNSDANFAWR